MKTILYSHPRFTSLLQSPMEGAAEITAYFLHSERNGDFNIKDYSLKKRSSTKNKTCTNLYWVPNFKDANGNISMEEKANLERGKKFFSAKEGFLFGAMVDLRKSGAIVKLMS